MNQLKCHYIKITNTDERFKTWRLDWRICGRVSIKAVVGRFLGFLGKRIIFSGPGSLSTDDLVWTAKVIVGGDCPRSQHLLNDMGRKKIENVVKKLWSFGSLVVGLVIEGKLVFDQNSGLMIHESSAFHTVWNVTIRIYPEACPVEEGDDILSHRGTSFNAKHRLYLPMLTYYTWPSISDLIPDSKKKCLLLHSLGL